jgi:hypothetical protein
VQTAPIRGKYGFEALAGIQLAMIPNAFGVLSEPFL